MATTLPRLRGSNDPPTSALPALPLPKSRKSTGGIGSPSRTPRSGLRTPSAASFHGGPPLSPAPTVALPKPRGAGVNSAGRSIRKTVSINSFPQPPSRSGSMPPSPLSGTVTPARRARTPQLTSKNGFQSSVTPSLLNGGGEGKSLLGGAGTRHSDGVISIASPPQSRSSSAQGSCSTSATTYDDPSESNGTGLREKRASKGLDGKGNVLVSVRVRPDAGGSTGQTEGEWMVDGRKSLVAYRGREGGDYYYGQSLAPQSLTLLTAPR